MGMNYIYDVLIMIHILESFLAYDCHAAPLCVMKPSDTAATATATAAAGEGTRP